eukprot:133358-Amphidinium_carterae.1
MEGNGKKKTSSYFGRSLFRVGLVWAGFYITAFARLPCLQRKQSVGCCGSAAVPSLLLRRRLEAGPDVLLMRKGVITSQCIVATE